MTTGYTRLASFQASIAVGALLLAGLAGMRGADTDAAPATSRPAVHASPSGASSEMARGRAAATGDAVAAVVVEQADIELVGASIAAYDR